HHVKHFSRPLADSPELIWEQANFEERYGRRGFRFEEGRNDTETWLDVYATDSALLRMRHKGYETKQERS
ncbi:MAG: hypothetical protein K8R46_05155, partial [Pirellulales bacterium]|nr:hypothetical protein [Pirellulales bacterium]